MPDPCCVVCGQAATRIGMAAPHPDAPLHYRWTCARRACNERAYRQNLETPGAKADYEAAVLALCAQYHIPQED